MKYYRVMVNNVLSMDNFQKVFYNKQEAHDWCDYFHTKYGNWINLSVYEYEL